MMSSRSCERRSVGGLHRAVRRRTFLRLALVALCLVVTGRVPAQVVPAGDKGGLTVFAGATGSGYEVQYGQQKLLGVSAIVDVDTTRRFGVEAEARWLLFHQTDDLRATTWLAGPRYHFTRGNLQFYGKGLAGVAQLTFPYNYAHGSYLAISPGGGLDYRLSRRISLRLVDVEYQYWPQFTFGSLSSYGLSTGVRCHVF